MSSNVFVIDKSVPDVSQNTQWLIGVVISRFNESFCNKMENAVLDELKQIGVLEKNITLVRVPGALEIPVVIQELADVGRFDALIALGIVIRGETYHFEVVSLKSAEGLMSVSLDHHIPVANGILTVENDDQALVRVEIKARECARVAIEMAHTFRVIETI
jgi:6,7-dimethyl-8-ribityllumazine synthase